VAAKVVATLILWDGHRSLLLNVAEAAAGEVPATAVVAVEAEAAVVVVVAVVAEAAEAAAEEEASPLPTLPHS
jgi:hypothetical protein